ncbi:MAG: hypothetical protein E7541_01695 [Ruminococcaceae bacterium]|nr:hypothetical protein [Oscillospiraceae bacterium]
MRMEDLRNPPKQYRPSPFWSWNERLDTEETRRQVRQMDEAGMGGYFMHARGGLQTPYMQEEWFQNVHAAVEEGSRRGMWAWGYDENGWPSGFGSGMVNGMGVRYQQKYLRHAVTDTPQKTERTIANVEVDGVNHHFYYDVNPFYVDTLDKAVTEAFLRTTHQVYKDTMGEEFTQMKGFFTDEPQVSRDGLPWSFILEDAFRCTYGEDLLPLLPGLFIDTPDHRRVRYQYWKLVRDLFADHFIKPIYDWCRENGSKLTGHMVLEENYYDHVLSNGCCMPHYEFMDIPGMDHLGRSLASIQNEMQLCSVAEQLGKKQILSETFALSGWNVSFEDLRQIYEHQMVHGVNYLCQHLEGYSLRGIRKRDYPASLFKHQPWWPHYRLFNDMVSRIGMLIAEGENRPQVLVLHTVETAWIRLLENDRSVDGIAHQMVETMNALEHAQIPYHLGDGRILERHGRVENGQVKVGCQSYSVVIVPPAACFGEHTRRLLEAFKDQGGTLIFTEEAPRYTDGVEDDRWEALIGGCPVVEHTAVDKAVPDTVRPIALSYDADPHAEPILCAIRRFDDNGMTMYYLVNQGNAHHVTATVKGGSATLFDPFTGEQEPVAYRTENGRLTATLSLACKGSAVLFVYDREEAGRGVPAATMTGQSISPKLIGAWEIVRQDDNALTLDYCDVTFDGECAGTNVPISDVQEMACAYGRPVDTTLTFRFTVAEKAFTRCALVVETPDIFAITLNGQPISNIDDGYYFDRAFRTIDIFPYVQEGVNELTLSCRFVQSAETYAALERSLHFESEKNKLSYDMELEAVYIKGDFGVTSDKPFEELPRRGLRTEGRFTVGRAPTTVTDGALAPQGYPFFAGTMTFRKTIRLTAEEAARATVTFDRLPSTVTAVRINGQEAGQVLWQPYEVNVAPLCREGENTVEITVTGNLRNLLGPFHLAEGESFAVCPHSFFHHSPVWLHGDNRAWVDSYCFVEYGLFF